MLRADPFAFAAADAVGGPAAVLGVDLAIIVVRVPVAVDLLGVHHREEVGDRDVLRAAGRAVAAGRAGDEALTAEDLLHPFDRGKLRLVERLKVAHESNIVLHLPQVAHAGEHHPNAREARREADGVARAAAAVQGVQHRCGVLRQIGEIAALDRLHHDDRLAVLPADLVAPAALHGGIVVVHIVELQLHGLELRVFGQDAVEHLRAVVERDADMAHLALGLERERRFIGAAGLEMLKIFHALRVHQIEVEIVHAAGGELAFKKGADVRLRFEEVRRQLVGQNIVLTRIAARQAGLQRRFAPPVQIAVGGVKIVEAGCQKGVHHLLRLREVDLLSLHRQAHKAKAKILFDLFHIRFSSRFPSDVGPLFFYDSITRAAGKYPFLVF